MEEYALVTRDANGNVIVDSSFALGKLLGIGTYNAQSGSITDPGWAAGRPFWILTPYSTGSSFFGAPSQSFSDTTLSWSNGSSGTIQIVWGIY